MRKKLLGLIVGASFLLIGSPAHACVEIDTNWDPTDPEASPAVVEPARC